MIQSIIRYMRGYVKIRVEGYSPERFLNLCRHH
ncbi:sporulation protein YqfD, partial [Muricomes intestini]